MIKIDFVGHSPFYCSISKNAKESPFKGFNIVNNTLKHTTWGDKETGRLLSKKKRVPKSMKEFAQLNKREQSHILMQICERLPLSYNKS